MLLWIPRWTSMQPGSYKYNLSFPQYKRPRTSEQEGTRKQIKQQGWREMSKEKVGVTLQSLALEKLGYGHFSSTTSHHNQLCTRYMDKDTPQCVFEVLEPLYWDKRVEAGGRRGFLWGHGLSTD